MKQALLENFFSKHSIIKYQFTPPTADISADWIMNHSLAPYVVLPINADYTAMLKEAQALDDLYVEHRSNVSEGWASLVLHGISSQHTDHYAVYPGYQHLQNDEVPYTWTEIQDRCPITIDFLKNSFPYDVYHRVRFMRLSPGGYVLPHHDRSTHQICAVNISLNNPQNCEFVFEDIGLVPFSDSGSTLAIATGYTHSIWNRSLNPRYHMIIHGYGDNTQWESLLIKGYQSLTPMVVGI